MVLFAFKCLAAVRKAPAKVAQHSRHLPLQAQECHNRQQAKSCCLPGPLTILDSMAFIDTPSPDISLLAARSYAERAQHFLEGTGAMVPDRVNGVVYCSLSERAEEMLARQWASELGYKDVVTFR